VSFGGQNLVVLALGATGQCGERRLGDRRLALVAAGAKGADAAWARVTKEIGMFKAVIDQAGIPKL